MSRRSLPFSLSINANSPSVVFTPATSTTQKGLQPDICVSRCQDGSDVIAGGNGKYCRINDTTGIKTLYFPPITSKSEIYNYVNTFNQNISEFKSAIQISELNIADFLVLPIGDAHVCKPTNESPYMVKYEQEHIDGSDLYTLIKSDALTDEDVASIFLQLSFVFFWMHQPDLNNPNYIHNDLRLKNIMVKRIDPTEGVYLRADKRPDQLKAFT